MTLIRAGGHSETIAGQQVRFSSAMLAGQYAYDRVKAAQTGGNDIAALRGALVSLWKVRHHFDLKTATGYALGLAHADAAMNRLAAHTTESTITHTGR